MSRCATLRARSLFTANRFIALGEVVHRVSGLPLDQFARQNIFIPLGMGSTGFRPARSHVKRIAPTEKRRGQLSYLGDSPDNIRAAGEKWLRGEVHDPTSFRMSGIAGHAGLFSTARDVAIYCQMILNKGVCRGARILSPTSIVTMTSSRQVAANGWSRGLVGTSIQIFPPIVVMLFRSARLVTQVLLERQFG